MQLTAVLPLLSDTAPTGPDLSFSPAFDQIAELRRADDPTLAQGEWVREIKSADWPGVVQLCSDLLSTQTKDLRLAGWMTEALAHSQGFAGMAQGLEVCAGLCETFWDALHPQADEDAPANAPGERFEQRIGNLTWLLGQVVELAQTHPLITGKAEGSAYGLRVIEAARARKGSDPDPQVRSREPGEEQIAQALAQTPGPALLASLQDVEAAQRALARLQAVVDERLGVDGPNFSAAREALAGTAHLLTRFVKERGLQQGPGAQGDTADAVPGDGHDAAAPNGLPGGPPATRAQALAQLRQVAEFFRRTEPHSPVAYLADKAARWGEVPLHEWLRSVLKDQGALAHLEELLGVEPGAQPDGR